MQTVGEKLKERRLELGYSLEDIQEKTKLSILHLRAIEEGDIAYFHHDLSYLKFFLQYYSQALHLDYEEIEPDFLESLTRYDETLTLEKQEQRQRSNEYIKERISTNSKNYKSTRTKYRIKRADPTTIIVLLLIVIMSTLLIYGVIKFVPQLFKSKPNNNDNQPVITPIDTSTNETITETVIVETNPVETPTETETPIFTVAASDATNYQIKTNQTEDIRIKFTFGQDTWIKVTIDEVVAKTPASKVYRKNETIEIIIDPEVSKLVSIRLGNLIGTTIFVNEQAVDLDASVKNFNSGITLNFRVEQYEHSQ